MGRHTAFIHNTSGIVDCGRLQTFATNDPRADISEMLKK